MCVFHPRDVEVGGLVKVCWIFFLLPYICGRKWSQLCTYYKETTGYYIQLRYAAIWLYRGLLEHTGMLLESWIRNVWGIVVAKSKRTVYAQQNTVERSLSIVVERKSLSIVVEKKIFKILELLKGFLSAVFYCFQILLLGPGSEKKTTTSTFD